MRCSIVVPSYNRLEYLKKCLTALLNLDFEDYEIIIVDDGSTDGTREYLAGLENKKIKVIHNERNLGPAISRNRGAKIARPACVGRYDIVAFIDDDCVAEKMWLRNLVGGFRDVNEIDLDKRADGFAEKNSLLPHLSVATDGCPPFAKGGNMIDFVFGRTYYIEKGYKGYFPERLVNVKNWPGAGNMAFRRDVFNKLGGFDSRFYYYHNEDSELAIMAVENVFSFKYIESAEVYHQKMNWEVKSLLASARNASVWAVLKKKYPKNYMIFKPPVLGGFIVNGIDYIYIIFSPILIPILFVRYLWNGKRDIKVFFAKWPVYLFLRRYYIYKEAIKNRIFMI